MKLGKIRLITFLLVLNSAYVSAKDHFYVIGGGGEPAGSKTIFDGSLTRLDRYLKSTNNWHKSIYFNGGHSETESLISKIPQDEPTQHFQPNDYEKFLQSTLLKIQNGDIQKGEKLLLFIDSHGAVRSADRNELTHSISSSDKNNMVNLDKLESIISLAHKKGIKVGLIDNSCHAGAIHSLEKFNSDMCIISASSDKNFSYTDFAENMAENFQKNKNLEEVFQHTRRASLAKGVPLINTPVGKVVQELIKEMHPLFFDPTYDPIGSANNKLEAFLDHKIQNSGVCQEIPIPEALMKAINKAEELSIVQKRVLFWTVTEKKEFTELSNLIKEHYKLLNAAKLKREVTLPLLDQKIKLTAPFQYSEYTWGEVARIDYEKYIKESEEIINNPNSSNVEKSSSQSLVKFYRAIKETHEKLKQKTDFIKAQAVQKELDDLYGKIGTSGSAIAHKERELYDSLYQSLEKTELGKAPNPCREFTL